MSQNWSCKCCGAANWPKHKVCWVCKAMRSYADATAGPSWHASPQSSQSRVSSGSSTLKQLQDQMNAITKQISAVEGNNPSFGHHCPQPVAPSAASPAVDRQACVSQLKQVEASLVALGDDSALADMRETLLKKQADLKNQIICTKPLGQQIDGCRAAVERSQKRLLDLDAEVVSVTKNRDAEVQKLAGLQNDLKQIESRVAEDLKQSTETSSLERLQKEMVKVVNDMTSSSFVEQSQASATRHAMEQLFGGLLLVSQQATANAAAASNVVPVPVRDEKLRLAEMFVANGVIQHPTDVPVPMDVLSPSGGIVQANALGGG